MTATRRPSDRSSSKIPIERLPEIARRHRWVVIALILTFLNYAIALALNVPLFLGSFRSARWPVMTAYIVIRLFSLVSLVRLSQGLKDPVISTIIQCFLTFLIFMDAPILAFIAYRAKLEMRSAGIHVPWYWISPAEVGRRVSANACRGCGYNLTGNVSGICPECGMRVTS